MASHKVLKSIAHNFGDSFTSMMNYRYTDYMLGHIQKRMRDTGKHRFTVDVLNKKAEPPQLVSSPIDESIRDYCRMFPSLVSRSKSSMDFIKSVVMTIEFDFTKSRPWSFDNRRTENPYQCVVTIVDENGKKHKATLEGWWFPET